MSWTEDRTRARTARGRAEEGFTEFVATRGDALWRSAWLLTGDGGRAEDLVQSALAKCWPKWNRLDDAGAFEAYVRRAMFNTFASGWRRRWNGERPTGELPERAVGAEGGGPDAVALTDLRHDLLTALRELSPGQRAVVVLRFVEDRSERETAEMLGVSPGTVKSQTSRALAALRRSPALHEQDPDQEDA